MNTIADLNEAMEPKFEELGAQDIFEQLKLGNIPEARELKEQFEGDEERLGQLWRSYTITRETHKEQNRRYNYRTTPAAKTRSNQPCSQETS